MSLLTLSRWQFAITVIFHMTFPAITVGISILLCVLYGMHWRTNKPVYLQMFRFWRRIFAVGFALGVVAGIVITFEFGLDWGVFAAKTGPIMGPILGMEVVTAFFVEAGFIGILLYGDGRVRRPATWIIANNSWMQTPSGFVVRDGRFEPVNWFRVIFSPSFLWSWYHMLGAVLVSASFFVAGIGAWYLVKGRATPFARRSVSIGLGIAAIALPLQLFLGDHLAAHVLPAQLSKLEALDGYWSGTGNGDNTGYILFAIPDQQARDNLAQLSIPCLGSAIQKDLTCQTGVPGLDLTPAQDMPLMAPVFWGFRVMFYGALLMFWTVFYATIQRFRRRLWVSRRFHKWLMWMTPVGILTILGGWVTAETGRQPWVVFGYLRTSQAVSHLAPAELVFSVTGFILIYAVMLGAYIAYIVRTMRIGPERDHPDFRPGPPVPGEPGASHPVPAGVRVPDAALAGNTAMLAGGEAGAR